MTNHRIHFGVSLALLLWAASPLAAAVQLGSDVLAAHEFRPLAGKRVGLITNPSGVNCQGVRTAELLRQAQGVKLVALFGAEHGYYGTAPAGEEVKNCVDPRTKLPVYSLYGPGPTRKPTPAMLKGLDVMVYDIQDTGCRSYTFISTLGLAMEACGEAGVEFMVLDRPNPLGGLRVEGPQLNPKFRSFVGQWEIPYVYGLTCGELAFMINNEKWLRRPCKLTIVKMQGWGREMTWRDTGLTWVPTSPNIPRGTSPLHYVSTGLLGAVGGLNIGINYRMPFECVTAPWLDAQQFCRQLERYNLKGVAFKPFTIQYKDALQKGARLEFTDPARAPLMAINFHILEAVKTQTGRDLYAEAVKGHHSFGLFDKVCGTDTVRLALAARRPAARIIGSWKAGEDAFRKQRLPYLLYP